MNKQALILGLLIMSLSGCMNIPEANRASLDNISNISTETESKNLVFTKDKWWLSFNDPTLDKLIEKALENNKQLKIAKLNIEKSSNYIDLAKSKYGPNLNFQGSYQRERLDLGERITSGGKKIINLYDLQLNGSYNLDFFGKISSLVNEQKYQTEALKLYSNFVELNISNQVANLYGYWTYLQLEKQNLLERENVLRQLEDMEKKNIAYGASTIDQLLNLQEAIRQNEILIKNNSLNETLTINNLKILAGMKADDTIENLLISKSTSINKNLFKQIFIPNEINSDIVKNRPDVQYYLFLIKGQEENLKSLKADFYPQFSLNGSYGYTNFKTSDLFTPNSLFAGIGPSLYFPIFNRGQIKTNYKIGGVDLNIFIENYNDNLLTAFKSVNDNLSQTKTAVNNLELIKTNFEASSELLNRNEKRYSLGSLSESSFLQEKYNWLQDSLSVTQQNYSLYNAQLNLINSIGGIFSPTTSGGKYGNN